MPSKAETKVVTSSTGDSSGEREIEAEIWIQIGRISKWRCRAENELREAVLNELIIAPPKSAIVVTCRWIIIEREWKIAPCPALENAVNARLLSMLRDAIDKLPPDLRARWSPLLIDSTAPLIARLRFEPKNAPVWTRIRERTVALEMSNVIRPLYVEWKGEVIAFLKYWGASQTEAEDITQEAFVRALTSLCDCEERSSVKAWLKRVAKNILTDRRRHERVARGDPPTPRRGGSRNDRADRFDVIRAEAQDNRQKKNEQTLNLGATPASSGVANDAQPASGGTPAQPKLLVIACSKDDVVDHRQDVERDIIAMERLERLRGKLALLSEHNQTLLDLHLDGKSYDEIGKEYGMKPSAVRQLIFRVRQKLRDEP